MKKLLYLTYYQLVIFMRMKEAIFFSIILPSFVFVLFGNVFSINDEYVPFLLTGVIGSAIASDALYGVAPMIKAYYSSGFIKYLKNFPINKLYPFIAIIISRFIILIFTILLLFVSAKIFFKFLPNISEIPIFLFGAFIGLSIYAFIGLIISFYGMKDDREKGIISLVYFLTIFLSDCFFAVSKANDFLGTVTNVFPMTHTLLFMRGSSFYLFIMFLWLAFFSLIFIYIFKRYQISR